MGYLPPLRPLTFLNALPYRLSDQTARNPLLTRPSDLVVNTAKMGHEDAVYLAKLAEQAERYEGK